MNVGDEAREIFKGIRTRMYRNTRTTSTELVSAKPTTAQGTTLKQFTIPSYAKTSVLKLKLTNLGVAFGFKDFLLAISDKSSAKPAGSNADGWGRSGVLRSHYWYLPSLAKGEQIESPQFEATGPGLAQIDLLAWHVESDSLTKVDIDIKLIAISKDESGHEMEFIKGFSEDHE